MTKMSSTRMVLAATTLMLLAASVAFLSNASAQERPPAERPVVEQPAPPPADENAPPPREPMQRPSEVVEEQAEDDAQDVSDAAADSSTPEDAPATPPPPIAVPLPPIPIAPPELDEEHQAFQECVGEVLNTVLPNGPSDEADFDLVDDLIFEQCVPLLPEDEQAAIIARRPYEECVQDLYSGGNEEMPMTEEEYMAIEAAILEVCVPLLPAEEQAQILAYNAYQTCIEEARGDDYGQASYAYAAQGCLSVLPAELAEMEAMYVNYQVCLADNGAFDNQPIFNADTQYSIHVSTPDGQIIVNLGSEPSSVTIDSDGSSLTVTADGDSQVFEMNYEEHGSIKEVAYEACADLSPFPEGPMPLPVDAATADEAAAAAAAVEAAAAAEAAQEALMPAVNSFARTARANR